MPSTYPMNEGACTVREGEMRLRVRSKIKASIACTLRERLRGSGVVGHVVLLTRFLPTVALATLNDE